MPEPNFDGRERTPVVPGIVAKGGARRPRRSPDANGPGPERPTHGAASLSVTAVSSSRRARTLAAGCRVAGAGGRRIPRRAGRLQHDRPVGGERLRSARRCKLRASGSIGAGPIAPVVESWRYALRKSSITNAARRHATTTPLEDFERPGRIPIVFVNHAGGSSSSSRNRAARGDATGRSPSWRSSLS